MGERRRYYRQGLRTKEPTALICKRHRKTIFRKSRSIKKYDIQRAFSSCTANPPDLNLPAKRHRSSTLDLTVLATGALVAKKKVKMNVADTTGNDEELDGFRDLCKHADGFHSPLWLLKNLSALFKILLLAAPLQIQIQPGAQFHGRLFEESEKQFRIHRYLLRCELTHARGRQFRFTA